MQDGEDAVQTRESDTQSATPSESEKEDKQDDPHVEGDNSVPVECDVGKLMHANVNLHGLSRYDKYRLLTTEPSSDPASFPRTRPYPTAHTASFNHLG